MIALQHIDELEPIQAIEIDWAVKDMQDVLRVNLNWLTHPYGRAYRIDKQGEEKRFVLPEVYVGNTDGKYSLVPATPDNDKKAISFFTIGKERQLTKEMQASNYLSWDVGLIIWANLELINKELAKNEDFTQHLIKAVRRVIMRDLLGSGYKVEITTVDREYNEVFKEFTLQERRYVVMPFTAFRFNLIVTLKEGCGVTEVITDVRKKK